jgi:DNA-binding LytR/AlgR family response regulator
MEKLRLKIKGMLLNRLAKKCTNDEIDLLSDQLINFYQENKLIPLKNVSNEIVWINIEEILYIIKSKKQFEYHTINSMYLHYNKDNMDIEDLLFNENFIMCDSKLVVNVPRVKKYDSYKNILYFEESISQSSKKVITIQERIKMFKKILGLENDVVEPENLIYTPNYNKKPCST